MEFTEIISGIIHLIDRLYSSFYANIISAVVILFVGFIIGKIAGKLVFRILHELGIDDIMKKAVGIEKPIEKLASSLAAYFIYFMALIMALNQLRITTTVLQMVVAAAMLLFIISFILAVKDFIPNMFAGIYIFKNRHVAEGEFIKVKGIQGKVTAITLLETKLRTKEGDTVCIPNSLLIKNEVIKVKKGRKTTVKTNIKMKD